MSNRHRVFISYQDTVDESFKKIFELRSGKAFGAIVPGSVNGGAIDPNPNLPTETIRQKIRDEFLRDTSVTVVLIRAQTRQRKHIDWEVGSSIRDTRANPRSGPLGIVLPTYPCAKKFKYNRRTIPPRLHDNIECGFASIRNRSEHAATVQDWVHQAYLRRSSKQPGSSRASCGKNRIGDAWTD